MAGPNGSSANTKTQVELAQEAYNLRKASRKKSVDPNFKPTNRHWRRGYKKFGEKHDASKKPEHPQEASPSKPEVELPRAVGISNVDDGTFLGIHVDNPMFKNQKVNIDFGLDKNGYITDFVMTLDPHGNAKFTRDGYWATMSGVDPTIVAAFNEIPCNVMGQMSEEGVVKWVCEGGLLDPASRVYRKRLSYKTKTKLPAKSRMGDEEAIRRVEKLIATGEVRLHKKSDGTVVELPDVQLWYRPNTDNGTGV
jgi:hypothetical protein